MNSHLEAAILGAIQGLTEFLPISSSGHLVIAQSLLKTKLPALVFDVFLHFGTLIAVLIVFRKETWSLLRAIPRLPSFTLHLFQKGHLAIGDDPAAWTVILLFVTTAVTGAIGIAFHDFFEKTFTSIRETSVEVILTGVLLFAIRKKGGTDDNRKRRREGKTAVTMTLLDAFLIGLAQAIAILPGISRSGSTIGVGLLLGLTRSFAGEFSFLASIPAVAGAVVLELRRGLVLEGLNWGSVLIGTTISLILGIVSLSLLLGWIRAGKLGYFAYYCWALGGTILLLLQLGVIQA